MKRFHLLALLGLCVGLAAFGVTVLAQRQAPGQGQQGVQRQVSPNEILMRVQEMTEGMQQSMWAYLSFELETSDEQLIALRPLIAQSWNETQAAFKAAEEAGDAADLRATMQTVNQNLEALREAVKEPLDDEQKEALRGWLVEQTEAVRRQAQRRQRFGGNFQGQRGNFQGQGRRGGGEEQTAPREGRRPAGDGEQTAPREGRRRSPEAESDSGSAESPESNEEESENEDNERRTRERRGSGNDSD